MRFSRCLGSVMRAAALAAGLSAALAPMAEARPRPRPGGGFRLFSAAESFFLANRIHANIRQLKGALIRVASYAALTEKALSLEMVEDLLRDVIQEDSRYAVCIVAIQEKVAEHFAIPLSDMMSRRRPENIASARQIAMFISRQMTEISSSAIGQAFGGRDHATVLRACQLVKDRMDVDPNFRQLVSSLERQLIR